MIKRCLLLLMTYSVLIAHATAQVAELTTDRPDQSNTPILIPKGALQIETGVVMEKDNTKMNRMNYQYNNTLLKFGINQYFEARLALAYLGVKTISDDTPLRGWSPVALGVKIRLTDQNKSGPQAALISNITLKTGEEYFRPTHTCSDLTFALSQSVNERVSVTLNTGIKWDGDSPNATALYTLSAGYNITADLSMFAEVYGFFPEGEKSDHRADAGLTYKIRPRLQYDVSSGVGISNNAPQYFISTGLSVRLFK